MYLSLYELMNWKLKILYQFFSIGLYFGLGSMYMYKQTWACHEIGNQSFIVDSRTLRAKSMEGKQVPTALRQKRNPMLNEWVVTRFMIIPQKIRHQTRIRVLERATGTRLYGMWIFGRVKNKMLQHIPW